MVDDKGKKDQLAASDVKEATENLKDAAKKKSDK